MSSSLRRKSSFTFGIPDNPTPEEKYNLRKTIFMNEVRLQWAKFSNLCGCFLQEKNFQLMYAELSDFRCRVMLNLSALAILDKDKKLENEQEQKAQESKIEEREASITFDITQATLTSLQQNLNELEQTQYLKMFKDHFSELSTWTQEKIQEFKVLPAPVLSPHPK